MTPEELDVGEAELAARPGWVDIKVYDNGGPYLHLEDGKGCTVALIPKGETPDGLPLRLARVLAGLPLLAVRMIAEIRTCWGVLADAEEESEMYRRGYIDGQRDMKERVVEQIGEEQAGEYVSKWVHVREYRRRDE